MSKDERIDSRKRVITLELDTTEAEEKLDRIAEKIELISNEYMEFNKNIKKLENEKESFIEFIKKEN